MTANNHTLIGTAGGTFLSIVPNISSDDITKTVVLATVGAVVSFTISLLLKSLNKKHKKKFSPSCGDRRVKPNESQVVRPGFYYFI
jgi:mannitol-specific phosphotransferase system IIBC component